MKKNIIFLVLTLFVSGQVFSQSSSRSKKKKERPVKVEEKPTIENTTLEITAVEDTQTEITPTKITTLNRARIDTKDGSTYLGEFMGETATSYELRIISGDTLSIAKDDVRRAKTPDNAIVLKRGKYHSTTGMYLHSSIGFNAGYDGGGFMTDLGLGYRLSKKLEIFTGLGFFGTNIRIFPTQNFWGEYKTFIPAYVGAKYNLTHGGVRIFTSAKLGYSTAPADAFNEFIWGQNNLTMSGGVYFEPSIGLSFASKRMGQSSISISQVMQRSNFTLNSVDIHSNLVSGFGKIWINRIGVKLTTTIF